MRFQGETFVFKFSGVGTRPDIRLFLGDKLDSHFVKSRGISIGLLLS